MRFRFLSLLAIFMVAGLLVLSSEVHATDEDTGWSRTTTEGAVASFTIEHRPDLTTEGEVKVTKSLRWGRNTAGVEVIDTVNLKGRLLLCEGEDCKTVWIVGANKDVSAEALLHMGSGSANLEVSLPVNVDVLDYNDTDGDGNRSEVVTSFTTDVSMTANWTWVATTTDFCGGQAAGNAISEETIQPASFNGSLASQELTPVSATFTRSDTIYGKVGSCA